MAACRYLTGENIAPRRAAEARALVGKKVEYLRSRDIDRSGRGYFFPRIGEVTRTWGRVLEFDHSGDPLAYRDLVEMRELE